MAVDKRGRKLPKGIRQRSETYEGRFTYKGQAYSVHGNTITETQKKMTDLKYKLQHGLFVESSKTTLNEWFEIWLKVYKKNKLKKGTISTYKKQYSYMVKEKLGKKYITDIRGEHIQTLYNDLVEEEYAVSSIKIVAAILSGCFKQAFKNGLIERNPVKLAEVPSDKEEHIMKAMTKEEQHMFMEYAKDSYLFNFYSMLLRTGLRNGELRGLKFSDIDKKKRVIHIRRTLKYEEGEGYYEDTPKTKSSRRDIPLTRDVEKLLDAQKYYWGEKIVNIRRYVFCTEEGKPLSRDRVQYEIDRIIKQINQSGNEFERITPHVFRHTFATRAIESGMKPQTLKAIMGHSSLSMTMDLYSHVMPDTKATEMEMIAVAF